MSSKRRNGKPPPFTEWHGNGYRAKFRIPEKLRFLFPVSRSGKRGAKTPFKKFLFENLHTDDPDMAHEAAKAFVASTKSRIGRIARQDRSTKGMLSEAQRWGKAIASDPNSNRHTHKPSATESITSEELQSLEVEPVYSEFDALVDRAYDLQSTTGHNRSMRFFNLASGRTTTIPSAMEDWLRAKNYSSSTKARYRRIASALVSWCQSRRIPQVLEAIDAKRANSFLCRHASSNSKAVANERAALSSLWQWYNARLMTDLKAEIDGHEDWIGDAGANPWQKVGAQISSKSKV